MRHSQGFEPRVEMTPLMDVVFLLLTFFIYSIVMTVKANVMPVSLPTLTTGQEAKDHNIAGVTVDRAGHFFLNRNQVSRDQLEEELSKLSQQDPAPQFFLAVESAAGEVDRGPLLIELIEMFRRLKIEKFSIVGTDSPQPPQDNKPNPSEQDAP